MSAIAPLVPREVDLRGLRWMPIDTVRLLDSDLNAISTGEQFRAAVRLWCKAWHQVPAASLPDDDRILATLSGYGPRWKKLREAAMRGFVKCTDGRWYHPVIAEKALEAWEHRDDFLEKNKNTTARQQRWRERQKQLSEQLRARGVTPPQGASLKELQQLLVGSRRLPEASTGASTSASTRDASEMPLTVQRQGQDKEKEKDIVGLKPDAHPPGRNGHDREHMRQLRAHAVQILLFLNEKTGRGYEPVDANIDPIVARLREGTTPDDIRAVIAKKCREWIGDEKMELYVRPKTLFNRTNFANYKGELGATG